MALLDSYLEHLARHAEDGQTIAHNLASCSLMQLELLHSVGLNVTITPANLAEHQAHDADRYAAARARRDVYHHALALHRAGELGA